MSRALAEGREVHPGHVFCLSPLAYSAELAASGPGRKYRTSKNKKHEMSTAESKLCKLMNTPSLTSTTLHSKCTHTHHAPTINPTQNNTNYVLHVLQHPILPLPLRNHCITYRNPSIKITNLKISRLPQMKNNVSRIKR